MNESNREIARQAMIRGYHDCGGGFQRVRTCDCDDSRIDGCKARVDAIASVLHEKLKSILTIVDHMKGTGSWDAATLDRVSDIIGPMLAEEGIKP